MNKATVYFKSSVCYILHQKKQYHKQVFLYIEKFNQIIFLSFQVLKFSLVGLVRLKNSSFDAVQD